MTFRPRSVFLGATEGFSIPLDAVGEKRGRDATARHGHATITEYHGPAALQERDSEDFLGRK